ncbi:MAG TPA: histidine phosphatase family protein [Lapillicoccus sp.]|jgi:phosphohistidine phosphatase|nr:histidine phosphatase family protein [Lapillicoccus sp.]
MSRVSDDRRLVLLRHAKAEQVPGKPDHDRELTDRGQRDATAAGRWLRDQGVVAELVICSTSKRTRQTWEYAARGGAHTEFVEYRRAVYQNGSAGVLETIREDAGEVRTLVVVGHAPSIPDLASGLTDGQGSPDAHVAMGEGYPTCGLAVLRFPGEWPDLEMGDCSLDRFHVCRG